MHKLYHFTVVNLVLPRRVSGAVKRVFATANWCNLCLQINQTQIVLSPFQFILIKRVFKTFPLRCHCSGYSSTFGSRSNGYGVRTLFLSPRLQKPCVSYLQLQVAIRLKLKREAQRATYRAPEYNVPPFWRIGQGDHPVFPIGPKNTNLVEDVDIFLLVKFPWIPFSGFRGEVQNVSANQRPGRPSCFSDRPKKHKLGRGH